MIKSTEKFNLSEPILITTKLNWLRLSAYNSVCNVKRRNSQFLYEDYILANIPGAYEIPERAELIKRRN